MAQRDATSPHTDARRATLRRLLGNIPPTRLSIHDRHAIDPPAPHVRAETLTLVARDGTRVRAFLTGPAAPWHALPAVLYIHAHGNRYDIGASELLAGRRALLTPSYAAALALAGIVALAIDLPCFGERATESEAAAAKRHFWHGRTLFGAMLADLEGAYDVLAVIDGVDPHRIGAFGISMGATLGFWLAAIDTRPKAVAHLCCFCDLETLVASSAHDLHGIYMTVPGLLPHLSTGAIAGLVAPRPQLACMGLTDPLTPPDAVDIGLSDLQLAYAAAGATAQLQTVISPDTGHIETPAMRAAVIDFLVRSL